MYAASKNKRVVAKLRKVGTRKVNLGDDMPGEYYDLRDALYKKAACGVVPAELVLEVLRQWLEDHFASTVK